MQRAAKCHMPYLALACRIASSPTCAAWSSILGRAAVCTAQHCGCLRCGSGTRRCMRHTSCDNLRLRCRAWCSLQASPWSPAAPVQLHSPAPLTPGSIVHPPSGGTRMYPCTAACSLTAGTASSSSRQAAREACARRHNPDCHAGGGTRATAPRRCDAQKHLSPRRTCSQ